MTKQVIAFDLDDTLAVAKSAITEKMAGLFGELLTNYQVCIISGGNMTQFEKQVLSNLDVTEQQLENLHLMPTCGTQYYRREAGEWVQKYAHILTDEQKQRAIAALEQSARELGYWVEEPYGEIIEDRGSQITLSALGQQAPADEKYAWDPTDEKKIAIRDKVAAMLPDLDARAGGTTSIDVTMKGVDKAYGMKELMSHTGLEMKDILFVGDKLEPGGNDYPVKALGIDSVAVEKWEDTALVIETLVKCK